MTRISKQQERRHKSPKKVIKTVFEKTGSKKDALKKGFKEHENSINGEYAFIAKIK